MTRINKTISWLPVAAAIAYRVRISAQDTNGADSVYDEAYAEVSVEPDEDGRIRVELVELGDIVPAEDGVYDITVSGVEESGNEGDFALLDDAVLDFTVLEAPKDLRLE